MAKLEQDPAPVVVSQSMGELRGDKTRKKYRDPQQISPVVNIIISVFLAILAFMCVFPFIYVIIISF